jgi:hypothetical protein
VEKDDAPLCWTAERGVRWGFLSSVIPLKWSHQKAGFWAVLVPSAHKANYNWGLWFLTTRLSKVVRYILFSPGSSWFTTLNGLLFPSTRQGNSVLCTNSPMRLTQQTATPLLWEVASSAPPSPPPPTLSVLSWLCPILWGWFSIPLHLHWQWWIIFTVNVIQFRLGVGCNPSTSCTG